jgi:hypothetical protein
MHRFLQSNRCSVRQAQDEKKLSVEVSLSIRARLNVLGTFKTFPRMLAGYQLANGRTNIRSVDGSSLVMRLTPSMRRSCDPLELFS